MGESHPLLHGGHARERENHGHVRGVDAQGGESHEHMRENQAFMRDIDAPDRK